MVQVGITIEGAAELERKLLAMERKVALKAIRKAFRAGAKIVQASAKQKVPVQRGALKRSIKVRAAKRSRKGSWAILVSTSKGNNLFTGEAYYGGMVEFGTSKMAAHPFLRPALMSNQEKVVNEVTARLRAEIAAATK